MTLDLAKRVGRLLSRRNVRVFLTRDDAVNIEGATRANVARFNGADILLSIHFNGDLDSRIRGTGTCATDKSCCYSSNSQRYRSRGKG